MMVLPLRADEFGLRLCNYFFDFVLFLAWIL